MGPSFRPSALHRDPGTDSCQMSPNRPFPYSSSFRTLYRHRPAKSYPSTVAPVARPARSDWRNGLPTTRRTAASRQPEADERSVAEWRKPVATPRKGDWRPATQGQPQRGAEGPVAAEQRERPRESVGSAEEATCVGPARWGAGTFVLNAQGGTRLQASERNLRGDSGRWRGQRKYRAASTKVRLCGVGGIVVSTAAFQNQYLLLDSMIYSRCIDLP